MDMEIQPIEIPQSVIGEIQPPVTSAIEPPVTGSIQVPVIEVPSIEIDYPEISVPTQTNLTDPPPPQVGPIDEEILPEPEEDTREMSPPETPETPPIPEPVIVVAPIVGEVELPPVAPLLTAGATALVTTTVVLVSNIVLGQVKQALDGPLKRMIEPKKKKKIKLKQKKPVLHYVMQEEGVAIFEYSAKGTRLVTTTNNPEQYIRDQVEESSVYEYDNVLLINDDIKQMFTKEGQKRFMKHFCPAKKIVKKLSAKFSF